MLRVIFGEEGLQAQGRIAYVSDYFNSVYTRDWLNHDLAKQIIKDIDHTEHVQDEFLMSPVLGGISPRDLSSGCKALLLLLNQPSVVVSGERMGDNCVGWLLRIGQMQDITITLHHCMQFPETFQLWSVNSGRMIENKKEYLEELIVSMS